MTKVRRKNAWLVLTGYCALALAIPALTPAPEIDAWPPIAPLVLADNFADDAMMLPLRQQARAAMHALQHSAEAF